jgi:hypothetical protein
MASFACSHSSAWGSQLVALRACNLTRLLHMVAVRCMRGHCVFAALLLRLTVDKQACAQACFFAHSRESGTDA